MMVFVPSRSARTGFQSAGKSRLQVFNEHRGIFFIRLLPMFPCIPASVCDCEFQSMDILDKFLWYHV